MAALRGICFFFFVAVASLIQEGLGLPTKLQQRSMDRILYYMIDFGAQRNNPENVKRNIMEKMHWQPTDEDKPRAYLRRETAHSVLQNENRKRVNGEENEKLPFIHQEKKASNEDKRKIMHVPQKRKEKELAGHPSVIEERGIPVRESKSSFHKEREFQPSDQYTGTEELEDEDRSAIHEEELRKLLPSDEENEWEKHQPLHEEKQETDQEFHLPTHKEKEDQKRNDHPSDNEKELRELHHPDQSEEEKREMHSLTEEHIKEPQWELHLPAHVEKDEKEREGHLSDYKEELRELHPPEEDEEEERDQIYDESQEQERQVHPLNYEEELELKKLPRFEKDEEFEREVKNWRGHLSDHRKEMRELSSLNEEKEEKREMHYSVQEHKKEAKRNFHVSANGEKEEKEQEDHHEKELRELHPPEEDEEEERDQNYEESEEKRREVNPLSHEEELRKLHPLEKDKKEEEREVYEQDGKERDEKRREAHPSDDLEFLTKLHSQKDEEEERNLHENLEEKRELYPFTNLEEVQDHGEEKEHQRHYRSSAVSHNEELDTPYQHGKEKKEKLLDSLFLENHLGHRRNTQKMKRLLSTLALMRLTKRNEDFPNKMKDDFPFTEDGNIPVHRASPRIAKRATRKAQAMYKFDGPIRGINDDKVEVFNNEEETKSKRYSNIFRRDDLRNPYEFE